VHQDIVVTAQMLIDPAGHGQDVLLLPAATRYEQRDGGTETTTERRVVFSPRVVRSAPGEARSEWEIFMQLAQRVDPERAELISFDSGLAIRDEIAEIVPFYRGIERLRKTGDQIQWGGRRLCDGWEFRTPDGKARFARVTPRELDLPDGHFILSSRRGKQFNSMVFRSKDPLTGADRDSLFMAIEDAGRLGVADGDPVIVRSEHGQLNSRVKLAPIRPGNVQAMFPEANALITAGPHDPASGVPDYNAVVQVEPLAAE
jgi:predicted molibdopterin-dependent oxidoreductase YjgC